MKTLPKKIKVKFDGIMYQLPSTVVRKQEHSVITKIELGSKSVASVIKQFVKAKYPSYSCWAKSERYSGGSSVRVYVSKSDGSKLPKEDYDVIDTYARTFRSGSFNGMDDSYNYEDNTRVTTLGNEVSSYTSYIFTYNEPYYGTIEWATNELEKSSTTPEYILSCLSGKRVIEKFNELISQPC